MDNERIAHNTNTLDQIYVRKKFTLFAFLFYLKPLSFEHFNNRHLLEFFELIGHYPVSEFCFVPHRSEGTLNIVMISIIYNSDGIDIGICEQIAFEYFFCRKKVMDNKGVVDIREVEEAHMPYNPLFLQSLDGIMQC